MAATPTAPAVRVGASSSAGEPMTCWQCGAQHPVQLFCPACSVIQPLPPQADYFQVFGIERSPVIDRAVLEARYFELSRRLHPDLFQTEPAPARAASMANTAALNRAYRTLRDPVERGLYWLRLHGGSLSIDNNQVPPGLAALVFEVQEQLEELRAARGQASSATLRQSVSTVLAELQTRRRELLDQLEVNFSAWPHDGDDSSLAELKKILSSLAYLQTLIRDVEKELEC